MKIFKNGIVHDGLGNVEVKDIAIEDGKFVAPKEEGAEIVDITGQHVIPGFIDPTSHWGVLGSMDEIRPSSNDNDETSAVSTPELEITYAFNGRGISKQQLTAYGITTVGVVPSDNNVFGGQASVFETKGIHPLKMIVKRNVAMKASVSTAVKKTYGAKGVLPMTKMGIFATLKEELRKAAAYNPEKDKRDEKLAALKQVTDGKMPVIISADNVQDAEFAKEILDEYKVKTIFVNVYGVNKDCDFLTDGSASLVLSYENSVINGKYMNTDYAGIYDLYKKGLPVAFTASTSFCGREDLLWAAIEMAKITKDAEASLCMLTSQPAKMLGIDDQVGTIEEGKRANFVLWSDNPIEHYTGEVLSTYLNGNVVYQKGDEPECY